MNYWLDLFTGTTWREFREAGADVSGFRPKQAKSAKRVEMEDIFLCYLTGVMRWVGALEIIGPSADTRQIWREQDFPVRFKVKPLILLEPEYGIPMAQLEGRVKFYSSSKDKGKFRGFVRNSLNLFQDTKDGELILSLLRDAEKNPIPRAVDPKKLARKPLSSSSSPRKIMAKPKPSTKPTEKVWDKPRKCQIFLPLGSLKPKPTK